MKKKQRILIEISAALLAVVVLGTVMVPKFLASQSINTPARIPDENFRAYLESRMKINPGAPYSKFDAAEKIQGIAIDKNLFQNQISSLKGIEYFTSVHNLHVKHTSIKELDISALEKLTYLDISENQLRSVTLPFADKLSHIIIIKNQIETLDLTKTPTLKKFQSTQNQLKVIDTSNNPQLTLFDVSFNHLQKIDLSNNFQLNQIAVNDNPLTELVLPASAPITTIILSNTKLERLPDLTAFTALSRLDYRGNQIHPDDLETLRNLAEQIGISRITESGMAWSGVAYDNQN